MENIIKSGVKLTGIRAEYHGPDPIDENTEGYDAEKRQYLIKDTDLTVTAFYDDGTEKILPQGSWILDNPLADGSSDSYTGLVRYREKRNGENSILYYWNTASKTLEEVSGCYGTERRNYCKGRR